jgi:hypothetical protein
MTHATKFKRLFIGWSSPVCGIISKSVCRGILAGKETKADISKETNSVLVKKAQPMKRRLNLVACVISGDICAVKDFRRTLSSIIASWRPATIKQYQLYWKSGLFGAIDGTVIPLIPLICKIHLKNGKVCDNIDLLQFITEYDKFVDFKK